MTISTYPEAINDDGINDISSILHPFIQDDTTSNKEKENNNKYPW